MKMIVIINRLIHSREMLEFRKSPPLQLDVTEFPRKMAGPQRLWAHLLEPSAGL